MERPGCLWAIDGVNMGVARGRGAGGDERAKTVASEWEGFWTRQLL